jgi:hypothetical protein
LVPGISDDPISCEVYGDLCLFEGDFVLGHIDAAGNLIIGGLLAQMSAEHALSPSEARRLSIVKDFSAFYWPDGIVRGSETCCESLLVLLFLCAVYRISACPAAVV